jgi:hypothetical protein
MKHTTLTILIALVTLNTFAQDITITTSETKTPKKERRQRSGPCPLIYFTISSGANNNTAITGFSFELPVSTHIAIEAGVGTGTWADKAYAGVKYYLQPCQRGFAFGTGLTYAPGIYHRWYDLETIDGTTQHNEFNKNPQANLMFAVYKYWNLGRKYNRIYAELGYSMHLTRPDKYGNRFTQLTGTPITEHAANSLNATAPGGPIAAVGISFGLH